MPDFAFVIAQNRVICAVGYCWFFSKTTNCNIQTLQNLGNIWVNNFEIVNITILFSEILWFENIHFDKIGGQKSLFLWVECKKKSPASVKMRGK